MNTRQRPEWLAVWSACHFPLHCAALRILFQFKVVGIHMNGCMPYHTEISPRPGFFVRKKPLQKIIQCSAFRKELRLSDPADSTEPTKQG